MHFSLIMVLAIHSRVECWLSQGATFNCTMQSGHVRILNHELESSRKVSQITKAVWINTVQMSAAISDV
jgi:hypothetical protein